MPVHTECDEAGVASTRGTASFDQPDAPAGGDQPSVDRVDAVFSERLEHTSNGGRDQKVDVVLGQLALALELDGVDPAAEHLAVQGGQALGQQRKRTQVGELLSRQV